jgi:curved DNA-binding protein CbpA
MGAPAGDPYATLGVARDASDADVRLAYRHLVQLHHPDHNGGSAESARRFEEIQDAYNRIRELREQPAQARPPRPRPPRPEPPRPEPPRPEPPRAAADPARDARLAQMEREVREAHLARERAQRAAREAAADRPERPSDEELGYVKTDDSFSKIFADARSELADLFSDRDKHSLAKRLGDLIDELDPRPRR